MAPSLSPRVEAVAQKQFKYVDIFNRYAVELRKDPVKAKDAHDRVGRDWNLVWYPNQDQSITQKILEDICSMEPKSLDDYVKVMGAAFAMINSIILHDMPNLTENERIQALTRLTQLDKQSRASEPPNPEIAFASLPFRPPLRKEQKSMSAPLALPGQRYSLQLLSDTMTYEICGVASDSNKSWRYNVKHEGEGDLAFEEELGQQDLLEMLESSVLLDE